MAIVMSISNYQLPELLASTLTLHNQEINSVYNLLSQCIDSNSPQTSERPQILPGVSEELDTLKVTAEKVNEFLYQVQAVEQGELQEIGVECALNVVFIRRVGYLLELIGEQPSEEALSIIGHSLAFQDEHAFYYKTQTLEELNRRFGDIQGQINDMQTSILLQISQQIVEKEPFLTQITNALAVLDAILSLANSAAQYGLTCPEIVESGFQVINGRHLLVELCVENYIPNDCGLIPPHKSMFITGPNFSGKSVYMKMIAIIVYLAHIGSFVPAEQASICIIDRLFTRLTCTDQVNSSYFTEEIRKLALALNNSTEKSLLIIDEFGKGTNVLDGMALFGALCQYIDQEQRPYCLVATHFLELIPFNVVKESEILKFYNMELPPTSEPVFLYKLKPGVSSNSLGIQCAKWAEIPQSVTLRAEGIRCNLRERTIVKPIKDFSRLARAKALIRFLCRLDLQRQPVRQVMAQLEAIMSTPKTQQKQLKVNGLLHNHP